MTSHTPPQYGRDYSSGNNQISRILENQVAVAHHYGPVPPEEYSDPQMFDVGRRPSQQQFQSIPRRNPSQPGGYPAQQQQYVPFSPIERPSQSLTATYPGQQQWTPLSRQQFQPSPVPPHHFAEMASPIERVMTPAEELAAARARSNFSQTREANVSQPRGEDAGLGLSHSVSILGAERPAGGRQYHEL
jgi:hypothetical protein